MFTLIFVLQILDPDLMKVFETVEREMEADGARFGSRLSDDELAKKRQKKYVFYEFFKHFFSTQVWS